jgi:glycosyltransferase involved in cell wall biosynthesis
MNLLWLGEIFPYPPNNGMKVWMINFMRSLPKWHDITLITASEAGEPAENVAVVERHVRVQVVHCPPEHAQPTPSQQACPAAVKKFSFPAYHQAVRDAMAQTSFDVVLAETPKMMQYVPEKIDGLTVLAEHDVEALRYRSTIKAKKGLRNKWWCYQEYLRSRRYEIDCLKRADLTISVAEHDVEILRRWVPTANVQFMPDPIDLDECVPFLTAPKDEKLISFCGAFNYYPNVDAALYFYREVFPLVKQQAPDAKLLLVGRKPPQAITDLCDDSSVTGTFDQPDIKPILSRSVVSVAPVRLGGGTKVKILTAMSLGLPVVTTPHGLEGLHAQAGTDLLIGRNTREFAQHVARLLQDQSLRQAVADAAWRSLKECYDVEVVSRQFHELVTTALEEKRSKVGKLAGWQVETCQPANLPTCQRK